MMSTMAMDTVPSMLFVFAMMCVCLGMFQKPACKNVGGFQDECDSIADLSFPTASSLACCAMCLCFMTHMGFLGRGSLMGAYGSYGMY